MVGLETLHQGVALVLVPEQVRFGDLPQQAAAPVPVEEPVEGVESVGAVPPEVGGAASNHLVGIDGITVAKGVEAGIDGYPAAAHELSESRQAPTFRQSLTQNQEIHQLLPDPGRNLEASFQAPLHPLGYTHRDLDGAAPPGCPLPQTPPHGAHELGQILSLFPLQAPREIERVAEPVELDAVEIPAIEELLDDPQLQLPHLGHLEIEGAPPVQVGNQPVGIESLEGGQLRVGKGAPGMLPIVDIVHPERYESPHPSPAAFIHDDPGRIVAGIGQALGVQVLVPGIDLDASVPGPALGEPETVGLAGPFQDVALVLGYVAAAETEQQGVDAAVPDGSKDQIGKFLAAQGAAVLRQGGASPAVNHGSIAVEQEPARPGIAAVGSAGIGQAGQSSGSRQEKAAPADRNGVGQGHGLV